MSIKHVLEDVKMVAEAAGFITKEAVKGVAETAALGASVVSDIVKDKIDDKKDKNTPIDCQTKEEFTNAMNNGYKVIVVKAPLYDDILEEAKEIRSGKTRKGIGTVGVIAGLLSSGGLGLILLGGGVISILTGKNKDSQKEYKIKIDELKEEIIFTLK